MTEVYCDIWHCKHNNKNNGGDARCMAEKIKYSYHIRQTCDGTFEIDQCETYEVEDDY